ncbi:hypothetical protein D3C87_1806990 [compost metagenome]
MLPGGGCRTNKMGAPYGLRRNTLPTVSAGTVSVPKARQREPEHYSALYKVRPNPAIPG